MVGASFKQSVELRHGDDCDFEGWITAVFIPIDNRHSNHRETDWTRVDTPWRSMQSPKILWGKIIARNSVRHPQYRHFGLGNPSFPVVRWIDVYVEPYNPQLSRIEPLINIGLLGSEALGHLRDETRQSKLSRIRKECQDRCMRYWESCENGNCPNSEIVQIAESPGAILHHLSKLED